MRTFLSHPILRTARRALLGVAALGAYVAPPARADVPLPPWFPSGAVPPSSSARSVVARVDPQGAAGDMVLFAEPSRTSARRGVTSVGTSLPFFGLQRGPGCNGAWWLVGPLAWTCSDQADLSPADSSARAQGPSSADGLTATYFFVNQDGASAYASLDTAEEGTPDRELEGGWGIAAVEQRSVRGEAWVRSSKGLWISTRDLSPARVSTFHGETVVAGRLDFAWVRADRAEGWATASTKEKPTSSRARFTLVRFADDDGDGPMAHLADGAWVQRQDLARPVAQKPPSEVHLRGERWVDVDLASQTLVAYEGTVPTYATLVSTGRGGEDATPRGVHRIWVKIVASDMGNSSHSDVEAHYALEDVPYVQFFDGAVALHGTYWHRDFGHARSHGCVNLAPLDARWLFEFTGPRVPGGWAAAYPTPFEEGTVVRVR